MNLIKALFNRLSDSLLSGMQERLDPATEFTPVASLRLVSEKPVVLPSLDAASVRRPIGHAMGQPDSVDDAIKRSQSWFLPASMRRGTGLQSWKPIPPSHPNI
ncbi:MAG: hypothetical protein U0236_14290 [Nitrospira sp.]